MGHGAAWWFSLLGPVGWIGLLLFVWVVGISFWLVEAL